jgi:serine protease inhibitor
MMTRHTAFLLCLATGAAACRGGPAAPVSGLPRELSVGEQQLIQTDNRFAFKLFREINAEDTTGGNLFISPLSVAMALGMTYNGARGATQEAMAQTLAIQGLSLQDVNASYRSLIDLLRALDPQVDFRIANSIWYRQGLAVRQDFVDLNQTYFDAVVKALDFTSPDAVPTINGWVNTSTNGKIPTILDDIPDSIVMYLINAIYFKGAWTYQFDKAQTKPAPFQLGSGGDTTVQMMSRGTAPARLYTGDGFRAADLSYGGDAYSMTILLPDAGQSVDAFADRLSPDVWDAMVVGFSTDSADVELPKFTLTYDLTLNHVLAALGMGIAFQGGAADLSGIAGSPGDLFISVVKHKTFLDVNEEGTEAAAVTSVGVGIVCACGPPVFRVDRPFLFAIRERLTGTILFIGKITNPGAA